MAPSLGNGVDLEFPVVSLFGRHSPANEASGVERLGSLPGSLHYKELPRFEVFDFFRQLFSRKTVLSHLLTPTLTTKRKSVNNILKIY
jgi:hypothetical protein